MTETQVPATTTDDLPTIGVVKLADLPKPPTRGELSAAEKAFAASVHDAASKSGMGAQLGTPYSAKADAFKAANRFKRLVGRAGVVPAGRAIRSRVTADGDVFRVSLYYADAKSAEAKS